MLGCAPVDERGPEADPSELDFAESGGRADTGGLRASDRQALGALIVASNTKVDDLIAPAPKGAGIPASAAMNIAWYRNGDDELPATADDGDEAQDAADGLLFDTLEELDRVPYVSANVFRLLVAYADAQGFTPPAACALRTSPLPSAEGRAQRALASVALDRTISASDWEIAAGILRQAPFGASRDARALLFTLADPSLSIDESVRRDMDRVLESEFGYSPALLKTAGPRRAVRANVTEHDEEFRCVSAVLGRASSSMPVAVIDSGFDLQHPLVGRRLAQNAGEVPDNDIDDDKNGLVDDRTGWDFVEAVPIERWFTQSEPDDFQHGTHVGPIAIRGTERLSLLPLRAMAGLSGVGTVGPRVSSALEYAVRRGARVVNLSQGVLVADVGSIRAAVDRYPNLLLVIAAGNNGRELGALPASQLDNSALASLRLPNVLTVAASDVSGKRTDYSAYGLLANLAALGDAVSGNPVRAETMFTLARGTSQAAPAVANVAAKCMLLEPSIDIAVLRKVLAFGSVPDPSWAGAVESGGVLDDVLAQRLTALLVLTADGTSPERAADRLFVFGAERSSLLSRFRELSDAL